MEEYISKSALVAELKRLQDALQDPAMKRESMQDYAHGGNKIINEIRSFLNTLKTKEVDLEKEIKRFTMSKELFEADSAIKAVAEHFFELGMAASSKAQKGE